jgi:multiple sugar transport system substrate-binding protein
MDEKKDSKKSELVSSQNSNFLSPYFNQRMTRRQALSTAAKAGIGVAAAAVVAGAGYGAYTQLLQPSGPTNLEWAIWAWGVELVQDNANKFNTANPDINVKVSVGSADYTQYVYTRFASSNPPDIFYTSPDMNELMLTKGWAADVETYEPNITQYKADLYPGLVDFYVNPATGKQFGLAYWVGPLSLAYNQRHMSASGFSAPPKTYDELASQAVAIKKTGTTQFPLGILWSWASGITLYNFMNGNHDPAAAKHYLFDENLNPIFNDKNTPLFEAIRWILDRIYVDQTMSSGVIQYDEAGITSAMGKGAISFALGFPDYDIAGANASGNSEAGNIHFGLNPGSGFANFQAGSYVTSSNVWQKGSKTQDAMWRLMQFVGGKTTGFKSDYSAGNFFVCNRILQLFGVTSGYKAVNESADGRAAMAKINMNPDEIIAQLNKMTTSMWRDPHTPSWWSTWWMTTANTTPSNTTFGGKFEKLITGQIGHSDADILNFLNGVATDWKTAKSQAGGK